jgi:hypothetical protein
MIPKTILDKLEDFLKNRKLENIEINDVNNLYEILNLILSEKYYDIPIQYILIDRSKYEANNFSPIPYRYKIEEDKNMSNDQKLKELEKRMELLIYNTQIAIDRLNNEIKIKGYK